MSSLSKFFPVVNPGLIMSCSDEHTKVLFDYFADQVDNNIQTALVSELMIRYADVSRQLEEKNQTLKKYNEHLEELVQDKVKEISALQMAIIHALVKSAEARDDDTGAHIERTASYCRLLAEKLKENGMYQDIVDDSYAENMKKASPLHDIGKIGIRDEVLLKPGRLTSDEFEIMKTHAVIGYETLASVEKLYPGNMFLALGMEISKYHHEKWDGSGYMSGLAGEEIPLSARIMALSDVYDALRSRRVYKEAYPHERALQIISEGRGSHFDPVLTIIFFEYHLLFRDIYDRLSGE